MNNVVHLKQVIQVKKLRAWGCATVDLINKDGSIRKRDKTLVVKFPDDVVDAVDAGSLWEVSGPEFVNLLHFKDVSIVEYTIVAEEIKYLRPSGRILARWLSANVPGIGPVIATRLLRLKNLNELVSNRDRDALLQVNGMNKTNVTKLLEKWPDEILHRTVEWLESQQLPLGLGEKLVSLFGANALMQVKENPFILMTMGASFEKTLAVTRALGFSESDEKVLAGIALQVVIQHCSRTGSTVISSCEVERGVSAVAKSLITADSGSIAARYGFLVKAGNGFQTYGTAVMEAAIAKFIADMHRRIPGDLCSTAGWEKRLTSHAIQDSISRYESELGFRLTEDQRKAVVGVISSPVSCISGGAGTGKTTILKAVLSVFTSFAGEEVPGFLMALSGRAAQRMAQSTGLPAHTIAKFISHFSGKRALNIPDHSLIIIDEASMLDLLSMYKLVGVLGSATRLLFVGDTSQLPPVGAGLVFHQLMDTGIPFFNLTQVKRQDEQSAIHRLALSIRNSAIQHYPEAQAFAEDKSCVLEAFTSISRLIDLWQEAGGISSCVILCATKSGELGVRNINSVLQSTVGEDRAPIFYQDMKRGWIPWITNAGTVLRQGDPVILIANNYDEDADLRNGDLGVITEVFNSLGLDGALGLFEVEGVSFRITQQVLAKLELGYAITIHKAQGSQWDTCFVLLSTESEHMLDQTLLYTAVTRPVRRLIVFGDTHLLQRAVQRGSSASSRLVFLRERINYCLHNL